MFIHFKKRDLNIRVKGLYGGGCPFLSLYKSEDTVKINFRHVFRNKMLYKQGYELCMNKTLFKALQNRI